MLNIKYHTKFHKILVHFGLFCVTCAFWQFSCRLEISFRSPRPKWNFGISFRSMISFHLKRVNNMWSLVKRRNETHTGLKFRSGPNFISATCNKPLIFFGKYGKFLWKIRGLTDFSSMTRIEWWRSNSGNSMNNQVKPEELDVNVLLWRKLSQKLTSRAGEVLEWEMSWWVEILSNHYHTYIYIYKCK